MKYKTKRSIQWVPQEKKQTGDARKYAGLHLLVDFWFGRIVEEPKKIEKILIEAAKRAGNTPLKTVIHKFLPRGITGVVLLAESHIAIHSWPEINYLGIDIYTCGEKTMPRKALAYFKNVYRPKKVEVQEIKRGRAYV